MAMEALTFKGSTGCPGCAGSIAVRLIMDALGPNTVVETSCPCAGAVSFRVKVPGICLMFPNAGSTAAGLAAALEMKGRSDVTVVAFAGDGGTADIGLQALSGAAERNDNVLYVCLDNEAYMNTGVQKSGSTPLGARTSTTVGGKKTVKKNMPWIMVYHYIPYVATATIAYPQDLVRKVKEASKIRGFKYLHVLLPCPPGWGYQPQKTCHVSKLAVETNFWPLYEVKEGKVTLNHRPKEVKPLKEYLAAQSRFRNAGPEIVERLQKDVDEEWARLLREAGR